MKTEEAIRLLNPDTRAEAIAEIEYKHGFRGADAAINKINKACKRACKALEKQIPKKPILEYHKESYPKDYGRLIKFLCPNCGSFIVAMYEIDVESGGIRKDLKGCLACLQAIDFTEYYRSSLRDERRNR